MDKNEINYQLSLVILKQRLSAGLLTREQFEAIDKENKKSFNHREKLLDL